MNIKYEINVYSALDEEGNEILAEDQSKSIEVIFFLNYMFDVILNTL